MVWEKAFDIVRYLMTLADEDRSLLKSILKIILLCFAVFLITELYLLVLIFCSIFREFDEFWNY